MTSAAMKGHGLLEGKVVVVTAAAGTGIGGAAARRCLEEGDRKSTRLNSSHSQISNPVFCLKQKRRGRHYKPHEKLGYPIPNPQPCFFYTSPPLPAAPPPTAGRQP